MQHDFTSIAFKSPAKAEANLARLEGVLPAPLHSPLASLLAQSPDPDGALNLLERYVTKAPAEVLAEMPACPTALTYLIAIFGSSSYLAETFLAEPGLPLQFARDRKFGKLRSKEDLTQDYARFATASPDAWFSAQLGRFKQRTYLRIALKDVLGMSTLAETTRELSELADVLVTNALAYCDQELRKRYGEPQYRDAQGRIVRSEFSIVSLGKMGGNELNYSSDIDLLFLYSHNGETAGGSEPDSVITNKEYFVRLAGAITRLITQTTPYGPVFRVDLRLRPEGDTGDMTISLKSALEYYERRARDWELQMLIKARHSAGDERLTREFLRAVEGRIYGTTADFAAIETILLSRERISKKFGRAAGIDVKRHPGGIRDIEFLTQCLQRLHGGRDPWVRSGGTLLALRKLNDKGHLSDRDYAALTTAYEFLRKIEHLVQLDHGQQTHRLPSDADALDRLARRAGLGLRERYSGLDNPTRSPGACLQDRLESIFKKVDEIYQSVIHPHAGPSQREDYALKPPSVPLLEQAGSSLALTVQILTAQAPELAASLAAARVPDRAQKNAARFLVNLLSSVESFDAARKHPDKLTQALVMIGASSYLAGLLLHHPMEMMALGSVPLPVSDGQMEMNLVFTDGASAQGAAPLFDWILEAGSLRERMSLLRRTYREQRLALAGRDLAGGGSVFESLRSWTQLATGSIRTALAMSLQEVRPKSVPGNSSSGLPFAVLGLGRLGIQEFDLASDADLVFVAASQTPRDEMELWTRFAGRLIEVLSSYTSDGTVFSVDARLRPLGREGELVVTEEALVRYAATQAQVWEAMAYLKAFPVAGNLALGHRVLESLTEQLLTRFSSYPALEDDLLQMRRRLERELAPAPTHLKLAPGGIYDIDYTLAYLQLRHHVAVPPGANTPERIEALRSAGLLPGEDASSLVAGAHFLRSTDHAIRLVTGRVSHGLPEHVGNAAMTEDIMRRWGLLSTPEGEQTLARRLREMQQEVRYVYRRLVGAE